MTSACVAPFSSNTYALGQCLKIAVFASLPLSVYLIHSVSVTLSVNLTLSLLLSFHSVSLVHSVVFFIFYFKNGITLQMPQMCNILKIEKHLFASTSITNECNICAYGTHNLRRITDNFFYSFQTEYKPSRSN